MTTTTERPQNTWYSWSVFEQENPDAATEIEAAYLGDDRTLELLREMDAVRYDAGQLVACAKTMVERWREWREEQAVAWIEGNQ